MQSKANNSQDLGKSNVSPEASTLKPVTEEEPEQPVEDTSAAQTTLGNVLEAAEELWPKSLAEDWDAVGLVTGRTSQKISKIVMAVDPTLEVIEDAIERGADLLIT
ncbi:NGG1p interacting factor NIF3, partial [Escherichia coli]|nr:NGG1p interacting factor NIF3 [Escherichia coli]